MECNYQLLGLVKQQQSGDLRDAVAPITESDIPDGHELLAAKVLAQRNPLFRRGGFAGGQSLFPFSVIRRTKFTDTPMPLMCFERISLPEAMETPQKLDSIVHLRALDTVSCD